jgi:phage gp29-like protein
MGKETIKTNLGKIECIKFSPSIRPGRIFRKNSRLYLWISNDANRIPVKAQAEVDTMLKGLGVEFTQEYIKKTYSLQDTEFTINSNPTPPTNPLNSFSAQSDIEDKMADKFQKTVEPIINMINKGKSFDEIKESVLEVNANLDTTELEELISDMIALRHLKYVTSSP